MNRRITDPGIFPAQAQVQLLRGQVGTGAQKFLENEFTLPGGLQSLGDEKVNEFMFCFGRGHNGLVENGFQFK